MCCSQALVGGGGGRREGGKAGLLEHQHHHSLLHPRLCCSLNAPWLTFAGDPASPYGLQWVSGDQVEKGVLVIKPGDDRKRCCRAGVEQGAIASIPAQERMCCCRSPGSYAGPTVSLGDLQPRRESQQERNGAPFRSRYSEGVHDQYPPVQGWDVSQ